MPRKGVVIVEERYGHNKQYNSHNGGYERERATCHNTPNEYKQWPQEQIDAKTGGIVEGFILDLAHNQEFQYPRGAHRQHTEEIIGQATKQGYRLPDRGEQGALISC